MNDPWNFGGEPAMRNTAGGSVTLVEGASFAISSSSGDIEPAATHGVFFEDTRFVSTWRVRLDGEELQTLAAISRHHCPPVAAKVATCTSMKPPPASRSRMSSRA